MTKLTLNEPASETLASAKGWTEVCNPDGKVIGFFTPATPIYEGEECPIPLEELERRSKSGRGRTLKEILDELEKAG